ncbi:MAG: universal stress protein [Haloplanus sp.]
MYDDILLPTDGSDPATAAAGHAIDLADRYDATVHALYVVDSRMSPVSSALEESELRDLLDGPPPTEPVATRCRDRSVAVRTALRAGVPHEEIVDYCRTNGIDLVVMGTHGRTGVARHLLGSTAERVVRTADRPVLIVPGERD